MSLNKKLVAFTSTNYKIKKSKGSTDNSPIIMEKFKLEVFVVFLTGNELNVAHNKD